MFGFVKKFKDRLEQKARSTFEQYAALVAKAGRDGDLSPGDALKLEALAAELGIPMDAPGISVASDCALARARHQLGPDVAAEKERAAAVEAAGRASAKYQAETDRIIEERRRGGWELDQVMSKAEAAMGKTRDAVNRIAEIEAQRPELFGKPSAEVQARQRHMVQLFKGDSEPRLAVPVVNFGFCMKNIRDYFAGGAVDFDALEFICIEGQSQSELDHLVSLARDCWFGRVPTLSYLVTVADGAGSRFKVAVGNVTTFEYLLEDCEKGTAEISDDTLMNAGDAVMKFIIHPGQSSGEFGAMLKKLAAACERGKAWRRGRPVPKDNDVRIVSSVEKGPGVAVTTAAG